jgi:hypothetical protein
MAAASVGRGVLLVLLVAGGCGNDANHSAPHLTRWLAEVPGDMSAPPDLLSPSAGGAPAVAGVVQFRLIFDQLLDGDKIETVDSTGTHGKTDVATITWVGAPAGAPAIVATTTYDPSGASSVTTPAPKVFIAPSPGLPSGAQLAVKLDRSKITGKKGLPFEGPDSLMVATLPFEVSASVMAGAAVAPDAELDLLFTNAVAASAATHVKVLSGGQPVAAEVKPGPDSRTLVVNPMPRVPGQSVTVVVDKGAADLFGVTLAQDFTLTFSWQSATDGGAVDGGVTSDAAADASAPVDSVPDTTMDAGASVDADLDAAAGG